MTTRHPATRQPVNPYRLSPKAWGKGYRDHELAVGLDAMGCIEPGYDDRQEELARLFDELADMDAAQLRAYIDGMHSHVGEHFM